MTLAERIAQAHDDWLNGIPGKPVEDFMVAAFVAHLASPEVVMAVKEALLEAIQANDGGAMIATEQPWTGIDCHVELDTVVRAALRAAGGVGVGS